MLRNLPAFAGRGDAPAPQEGASYPGSGLPNIFVAIQKQLGLKLVKVKDIPTDVLVIDSADKVPSENLMKRSMTILAILMTKCLCQAQEFDAASVRPASPDTRGAPFVSGGPGSSDPGVVTMRNIDLFTLVTMAWGLKRYQVSIATGSGPWMQFCALSRCHRAAEAGRDRGSISDDDPKPTS